MSWATSIENFSVRRADAISCPSNLLVRLLREKGLLNGQNPAVIPLFTNWQEWSNTKPANETEPIALSMGWLGINKAPEILAEAIGYVRKELPNARALFLGTSMENRDGLPYMEWIKHSLPDTSGCDFAGYVPRDEVIDSISSSRVVVMSSWFDNYPMAALEAMAGGRPVIVTETTGVAELVEKKGAGKVVPPGNPKALAEALRPFLRDPDFAAAAGERARKAIYELHDPDRISAQREVVYREAVEIFHNRPWRKFCRNLMLNSGLTS